jgi:hypothetical protein
MATHTPIQPRHRKKKPILCRKTPKTEACVISIDIQSIRQGLAGELPDAASSKRHRFRAPAHVINGCRHNITQHVDHGIGL